MALQEKHTSVCFVRADAPLQSEKYTADTIIVNNRKLNHDAANTHAHSRSKRSPFSYLGGIQPTVMLLGVADTMFTACGGADGGETRVRSSASREGTP